MSQTKDETIRDYSVYVNYALDKAEPGFKNNNINMRYMYNQVASEKPWDIKVPERWEKTIGVDYPGSYNTPIIVNGRVTTPEELGNMTYGYLGTAAGFRPWVLYTGGDFADAGLWGMITRSDSPEDKAAIKKGIEWYLYR